MTRRATRSALLALSSLLLISSVGCAAQGLYRWGIYEDLLWEGYKNPGGTDPVTDAIRLVEDVQETAAKGKAVPPGVHAHLGYLYYTQGNLDLAHEHFSREQDLYPESATFIGGILERMGQR